MNGKLSVMPKADKRPVTAFDMKIPVQSDLPAITLIKDGIINREALIEAGLDMAWLEGSLVQKGVDSVTDVLLAQVTSSNQLYVDHKNEWNENLNLGNEKLITKMYKLQADFQAHWLQTDDPKAKKDYISMKKQMDQMIRKFEAYIANKES